MYGAAAGEREADREADREAERGRVGFFFFLPQNSFLSIAFYASFFYSIAQMANKQKKMKPTKTTEVRSREARELRDKFMEIGFPMEDDAVREVLHVLQQFADEGIGASGVVRLPAWSVCARYKLSTQPHVTSELVITKTG